jgi:hypothetical protein
MGFGIEEEAVAHGLARIFTEGKGWDWVRRFGLCFLAIELSGYLAIKPQEKERGSR